MELQEGKIKYPDVGFAFNPIRLYVHKDLTSSVRSKKLWVKTTIKDKLHIIQKELTPDSDFIIFELSSVVRAMFDRSAFHQVKEEDDALYKTASFEIYNRMDEQTSTTGSGSRNDSDRSGGTRSTEVDEAEAATIDPIATISIPVIWGALQIGEVFTQDKTLTYFPGYPFTIPLFTANPIGIRINGQGESFTKTLGAGKYNLKISDYDTTGDFFLSLTDTRDGMSSVFDYTFDYTFGPPHRVIHIKVAQCSPQDGVYLRWINKHGEYNYYLFASEAIQVQTKSIGISFDNLYYTTELTDGYHSGTGGAVGKEITENTTLYAPLISRNDVQLLQGLVGSPVVDMFMGYKYEAGEGDTTITTEQWMAVSVADGTFIEANDHLQDFILTLIPPKIQVQTL